MMEKRVRITLVGSFIGQKPQHRATLHSLGLRKRHQSVELLLTPSVQGALRKVSHIVKVDEVGEE